MDEVNEGDPNGGAIADQPPAEDQPMDNYQEQPEEDNE